MKGTRWGDPQKAIMYRQTMRREQRSWEALELAVVVVSTKDIVGPQMILLFII